MIDFNQRKLEKIFLPSLLFLVLAIIALSSLFITNAATTGSVAATVSAQNLSLSVADGTVTYGAIGVGSSKSTVLSELNDSQDAVNIGNTNSTFNIVGQTSPNWGIGPSAGNEIYAHKFCKTNCDSSPTWTAMSTNYATLTTNIAVGGTQNFDLIIFPPTVTANYTSQSVNVTVQVTAP